MGVEECTEKGWEDLELLMKKENREEWVPGRGLCPPTAHCDPDGLNQHESGAKLDAGKARVGLVVKGFSRALQEVSKVGTFGANKYTDNGWKDVKNGKERYTDAMFRHLLEDDNSVDPESKLLHAAHAAWNALARLEFILNEEKKDD